MNTRKLTVLTALTALLALGEFGSAVIIGLGKDPWGAGFAVLFGGLFLLATWLLRSERITAGAIFAGILCLFEIIEYPSWQARHPGVDVSDRLRPVVAGRADGRYRRARRATPAPGRGLTRRVAQASDSGWRCARSAP